MFTAASLACGLAPAAVWLVLARVLQGAAAALMASQVLTGIQLNFDGAARGRALGWYAAVLAGSAVVGQILGALSGRVVVEITSLCSNYSCYARSKPSGQQITEQATSWPGVTTAIGDRGELAITLGRRQLGHLHGDHAAHFSFPKTVWRDLRAQGRVMPHPVFPDAEGPAARRIESQADVSEVIALLRLNYDRAIARHGLALEA